MRLSKIKFINIKITPIILFNNHFASNNWTECLIIFWEVFFYVRSGALSLKTGRFPRELLVEQYLAFLRQIRICQFAENSFINFVNKPIDTMI